MALDNPEDEVSPLWQMALADGKYRECPYLQSNRQGQCNRFRRFGPLACFHCGFQDGLEAGYDYGYEDGRNEPDFDAEIAEEEERWEGMD